MPDYFGVEFWNSLDPYIEHSATFNI